MKQPTQAEWNRLKRRRVGAAQGAPQSSEISPALPDDLFLPNDYGARPATSESPERPLKRRQFVRYDETWRARILTAEPLASREALYLIAVLLAEADFHRQIKITAGLTTAARLTRFNKRAALEDLERLGLIRVEWRGRGRAPIVTPLHLSGRPTRR